MRLANFEFWVPDGTLPQKDILPPIDSCSTINNLLNRQAIGIITRIPAIYDLEIVLMLHFGPDVRMAELQLQLDSVEVRYQSRKRMQYCTYKFYLHRAESELFEFRSPRSRLLLCT